MPYRTWKTSGVLLWCPHWWCPLFYGSPPQDQSRSGRQTPVRILQCLNDMMKDKKSIICRWRYCFPPGHASCTQGLYVGTNSCFRQKTKLNYVRRRVVLHWVHEVRVAHLQYNFASPLVPAMTIRRNFQDSQLKLVIMRACSCFACISHTIRSLLTPTVKPYLHQQEMQM